MQQKSLETKGDDKESLSKGARRTRRLKCPRCKMTYASKSSLRVHLLDFCGVEKRFECKYCTAKFRTEQTLMVHQKSTCLGLKNVVSFLFIFKFNHTAFHSN